eukprot:s4952_g4.t1
MLKLHLDLLLAPIALLQLQRQLLREPPRQLPRQLRKQNQDRGKGRGRGRAAAAAAAAAGAPAPAAADGASPAADAAPPVPAEPSAKKRRISIPPGVKVLSDEFFAPEAVVQKLRKQKTLWARKVPLLDCRHNE